MISLAIVPADVAAAGARALALAGALADQAAHLGRAPLALAGGGAGAGDPHLAADLETAVHDLRQTVEATLRLARALGVAPQRISEVDQRLASSTPFSSGSATATLASLPARAAALAGTLALEGFLHAVPHRTLSVITPLVAHVPDGPGWAIPIPTPTTTPAQRSVSPTTPGQWLATVTDAQVAPGQIEISHLDNGRWVVSMPGIHAFTEAPDPLDLPGAAHAFATGRSGYAGAVTMALTLAGVPLGAKLLLVGHSEGGIVAADLAADPAFATKWDVTHLLTAAAPIDDTPFPATTASLALRNRDDIVPDLELRPPPRDGNGRATVEFDDERGSVGANHDLRDTYLPEADSDGFAALPAVRDWEASAAPYLGGGPATTQRFQLLDRAPSPPKADGVSR